MPQALVSSNGPRLILSAIRLTQSGSSVRVPIVIGDQEYVFVSLELFILGQCITNITNDDQNKYHAESMKWKLIIRTRTGLEETLFLPIHSTIPKLIERYLYDYTYVKKENQGKDLPHVTE